jgi:hypothetical protein
MATQSDKVAPVASRQDTVERFGAARQYDEYRIKLYKVACRAAREQREQLRLDWEVRSRERD